MELRERDHPIHRRLLWPPSEAAFPLVAPSSFPFDLSTKCRLAQAGHWIASRFEFSSFGEAFSSANSDALISNVFYFHFSARARLHREGLRFESVAAHHSWRTRAILISADQNDPTPCQEHGTIK